ncbi:MAG TPA: hypothetical protein VHG72_02690 [Polyangia bacterium]|nr:hypothetical protein [Polyangia bacterium]
MSLSDLAALGSFVSGFAVLISLIYLALQVRQTKRNQQIAIRHSRATRVVDLHLRLADAAVADAWLDGSRSAQEITQAELGQYINLCRALFFHFEDSFYQREEGLLNDDAFETVVAGVRFSARSPGWRAAWGISRSNFGGRFLAFMDGLVAGSAVEPPVDLSLEAWRAAVASEASRSVGTTAASPRRSALGLDGQ